MLAVPPEAFDLARRFEGFHRVVQRRPVVMAGPYLCPADYWTIAYGHLCKPDQAPVDEAQGELWLEQDLRVALAATIHWCPRLVREPRRRLAAIVDWTFNLGGGRLKASTMRRRINDGAWDEVRRELLKWVWGGGRKLPGLIARREAEAVLL